MINELFTIKPNLKQYYGRTITKDTEFDEWSDDKTIHQTLKDLVLVTETNKETELNGMTFKEESKLTMTLQEGSVLIWQEGEGYILPNQPFYKLKDLEEEIETVKNIYKENKDINPE